MERKGLGVALDAGVLVTGNRASEIFR